MNHTKIPLLPRRYEDTKPALNQAFTHNAILEIGEKISQKSKENVDYTTKAAVQKCKDEVWRQAEAYKDECVATALKQAKAKEEHRLKLLQQKYEKTLKKELARTEEIVHHNGVEKLFEERQASEKRLNEVVTKLHSQFAIEKDAAIEATRKEEKQLAQEAADEAERQHQTVLQQLKDECQKDKHDSLDDLRQQMIVRTNEEVSEARLQEQKTANDRVREISEEYEKMVEELHGIIEEIKEKQRKTEAAFNAMEKLKDSYVLKLKTTRQAFVAFIEECRPDFSSGQADYLIPSSPIEIDDVNTTT